MTDQLRACAHCGGKPVDLGKDWVRCESEFCVSKLLCFKTKDWQNRPIEDKLRSDLALAVEALKRIADHENTLMIGRRAELAKQALQKISKSEHSEEQSECNEEGGGEC